MKRNWISIRRRTISLIAISTLLLLQGCASSTGNGGPSASFEEEKANAERYEPLVDNWKMLLKNSDLSDFERDVLERAVENGKSRRTTMNKPNRNTWNAWFPKDMTS